MPIGVDRRLQRIQLAVPGRRAKGHKVQGSSGEVGVEDETLACGTGAAASAYVAHHVWHQPYPIQGTVPGGEMHVDHTEQGLLISGATGHLFTNVPATATT